MDILAIQNAVREDNIFFTEHTARQMAKRNISDDEVVMTISSGEIIEEYPADKYGPSCLIYG
jgi:hypothetical protein